MDFTKHLYIIAGFLYNLLIVSLLVHKYQSVAAYSIIIFLILILPTNLYFVFNRKTVKE